MRLRPRHGRETLALEAPIRLGDELAFVSLPGEPFTEIGMQIRAASPFAVTLVVSNANGYAGYIAPDACLQRGGYEPLPVESGGAAPGMADKARDVALEALRQVAGKRR